MHRTVVETVVESKCCTSDLTLSEFKSLKGKMDASNPDATTAADYLGGTPSWAHGSLHRPRHVDDAPGEHRTE